VNGKIITIVFVLFILICLFSLIGIISHKSPIQRKLTGTWNIEFDSYVIGKEWNMCGNWIEIKSNTICELPAICDIDIDKAEKEATGAWEIISTNPDSVFFNVPKNPLHGKYALRFFIDKNGYRNMYKNIYKIELTNDSTYLICNKGDFMYKSEVYDWEGKN
jgi:hypothetical protein